MSSQLDKTIDEDYPWDRDTQAFKDLENRVKFHGLLVTESGYVFRKNGNQVKPKYVMSTLKDGSRKVKSVNIEFSMKGKRYYKSYQRFVYAAWNEDFDMDDSRNVVVSITDNQYEFRPSHLKSIPRAEHLENLRQLNMKYSDEERKLIAERYHELKGGITQEKFANHFEISIPTLADIIKEHPIDE